MFLCVTYPLATFSICQIYLIELKNASHIKMKHVSDLFSIFFFLTVLSRNFQNTSTGSGSAQVTSINNDLSLSVNQSFIDKYNCCRCDFQRKNCENHSSTTYNRKKRER